MKKQEESDVEGYSTDDSRKRQREEEENNDIKKKNKKTVRTPPKKKRSDTEMEDLKNMIQKLMEEVKEIRKENHKYHEILDKLAEENKERKRENNEMKTKMQYMEDKLEQMERHQKKNNIVIYGMELTKEKNETLEKKLEEWIKNNLRIDVEIESVYKINKEMYVGQVSKYEKKIEIMKKKSCLRENENKKIFITNDLTKKERDIQGWIREEANAEKEKGNKVRIGYKKLTINEKIWTWNSKTYRLEEQKEQVKRPQDSKN
jgi:hypothetical protein